jgi:hypothetical protein
MGMPELDIQFCLSWANETWSRRWHGSGAGGETLLEQTYSDADDVDHARWLTRAFSDPRYVRVRGRPLFLVYRPWDLPDPERTLATIRTESVMAGLPDPYLVAINAHRPTDDAGRLGFDTSLAFEPRFPAPSGQAGPGPTIHDYAAATTAMRAEPRTYPAHPCVMVGWDNTPRRGRDGIVFTDPGPAQFERHLRDVAASVQDQPRDERLLFLNAWNEWAEGNYLEPDLEHGMARLEAVRRVLLPTAAVALAG